MFDTAIQEFRYTFRSLMKSRGYALACVLTLTLGIGGVTAVFTVVNAILVAPLPYKEPDRLVMVWNHYGKVNSNHFDVSPPDFLDRKRDSKTLENMAAVEQTSMNLIGRGNAERIRTARVSTFPVFSPGSFAAFRQSFLKSRGGSIQEPCRRSESQSLEAPFWIGSNLIGETLNLSGTGYVVIGIMPASFWYPTFETELWTPLAFTARQMSDDARGNEYLSMIARMKSGVSLNEVQAEMSWIAAQVPGEFRTDVVFFCRVVGEQMLFL